MGKIWAIVPGKPIKGPSGSVLALFGSFVDGCRTRVKNLRVDGDSAMGRLVR